MNGRNRSLAQHSCTVGENELGNAGIETHCLVGDR